MGLTGFTRVATDPVEDLGFRYKPAEVTRELLYRRKSSHRISIIGPNDVLDRTAEAIRQSLSCPHQTSEGIGPDEQQHKYRGLDGT